MALTISVHYDEIGLKGKNRPFFEKKLRNNIKTALKPICPVSCRSLFGRIIVHAEEAGSDAWDRIRTALARVFGIAHFERIVETGADMDTIAGECLTLLPETSDISFAVRTTRSDKSYPLTSEEINRVIGAAIQRKRSWNVNLTKPDLTVYISIIGKKALISTKKIPGPGGLPAGASRKVICMISGGIDSPVAAYRIMRRGMPPVFVHFHSYPYTGKSSQERALKAAEVIAASQPPCSFHLVPLGEVQQEIVAEAAPELRILLYRRCMFRISEQIAQTEHAAAIATGEALGQVASQTIENMTAVQSAVSLPVLRPLIGFDKKEIVRHARELKVFEISTKGSDDCCSYLLPPRVATRSSAEELDAEERGLNVTELIREALEKMETVRLGG